MSCKDICNCNCQMREVEHHQISTLCMIVREAVAVWFLVSLQAQVLFLPLELNAYAEEMLNP